MLVDFKYIRPTIYAFRVEYFCLIVWLLLQSLSSSHYNVIRVLRGSYFINCVSFSRMIWPFFIHWISILSPIILCSVLVCFFPLIIWPVIVAMVSTCRRVFLPVIVFGSLLNNNMLNTPKLSCNLLFYFVMLRYKST